MAQSIGKKNKNQTAIERAQQKLVEGVRQSRHFCADVNCDNSSQPILVKDLYPVTQASLKGKRTVFYHRDCFYKK